MWICCLFVLHVAREQQIDKVFFTDIIKGLGKDKSYYMCLEKSLANRSLEYYVTVERAKPRVETTTKILEKNIMNLYKHYDF